MTETAPVTMTPAVSAQLREKFDGAHIGFKPKPYCKACKASQSGACQNHERKRCPKCNQNITTQHIDVEFVGHADVTDRLLQVDPSWTWEPVAWDEGGLPRFDSNGGLWIRLTVAGVTRLGYGGADGDTTEDGKKEAIGDAIKVAAMRFGVALDLWRKTEASAKDADPTPPRNQQNSRPANGHARPQTRGAAKPADAPADDIKSARKALAAHCAEHEPPYDLDKVAVKYKEQFGETLGEATDPLRVTAFMKRLASMPVHELTGAQT